MWISFFFLASFASWLHRHQCWAAITIKLYTDINGLQWVDPNDFRETMIFHCVPFDDDLNFSEMSSQPFGSYIIMMKSSTSFRFN